MSSAKSDNFTSSLLICMPFISFTSLVAVTRTYNIMLNRSDGNGHLCLIAEFRGRLESLSPLSLMLAVGLF